MRDGRDVLSARIVAPALLAALLLGLPILAVLARAPWHALTTHLGSTEIRSALLLSGVTSVASAALSVALGVPLAVTLTQTRGSVARWLRALTTLPIVLPPVVAGVALLLAFGRTGLVGHWLWETFHIQLPFSPVAVVMAQTFVAMPFLVVSVEGALRQSDTDLADAAATAGATRWQTLRHVTLPSIGPAVAAGAMLAWARAFGEFGATITFAGSFPGRTETMPIAVYLALQSNPDTAIALSLVMVAVSVAVLVLLRERWWIGAR